MRLIQALRAGEAAQVVTLDSAWREAEQLGRVEVDTPWSGTVVYSVTIIFESRTSRVHARGQSTNILDAVLAAIAEARRLQ
jgi:hypothetical protein